MTVVEIKQQCQYASTRCGNITSVCVAFVSIIITGDVPSEPLAPEFSGVPAEPLLPEFSVSSASTFIFLVLRLSSADSWDS